MYVLLPHQPPLSIICLRSSNGGCAPYISTSGMLRSSTKIIAVCPTGGPYTPTLKEQMRYWRGYAICRLKVELLLLVVNASFRRHVELEAPYAYIETQFESYKKNTLETEYLVCKWCYCFQILHEPFRLLSSFPSIISCVILALVFALKPRVKGLNLSWGSAYTSFITQADSRNKDRAFIF